jgi:MFS family permease
VSLTARLGRAARAAVSDITPLRESAAYRRLFAGQAVSSIGTQVTQVAVPVQVYSLTHSSLQVGLVSLAALIPLIFFGLYGGAIADAVERRKLLLITSVGTMAMSVALLAQAAAGVRSVPLLFVCVAVQAAFAAVDGPARRSITPLLVRPEKLPAANTLSYGAMTFSVIVGPVLAGVAVAAGGFQWAYGIDVATFVAALYAVARLPALPAAEDAPRAGLASVLQGLRFVRGQRIIMATFLADINAMIFGMPKALYPALAFGQYHGGAGTASLMYAAPAAGALLMTGLGGLITGVRHQGRGVILAIVVWGGSIALFGATSLLWFGLLMLALAGAADQVSAVYRSTMMQVVTPPGLQGRLQGVYMVVVAGGPRLGDLESGAVATAFTPRVSVVSGGLACLAGIGLLAALVPSLLRYDSREAVAERARLGEASPSVA